MLKTALLVFAVILLVNCSQVSFKVDFQIANNQKSHHTDNYRTSSGRLVLRRGGVFSVKIYPTGVTNATYDLRLTPVDAILNEPNTQYPTTSIPWVASLKDNTKWCTWTTDGTTYSINIPTNAYVGAYRFDILLRPAGTAYPTTQQIDILFNPWNSKDAVYMSDSTDISEYILNEDGMMWLGSSPSSGTGWTYDQFDENVLVVSLLLLDGLTYNQRNDVIAIARHLSSVINANNGGGLMYGRWQEPYTGGKAPWYWTGSGEIFTAYKTNGQTPVKWAQCWVFAGALTSAGRTLGIPARQITNFQSAHESSQYGPYRSSIDYLFDSTGAQKGMIGSIWNFHAWTEFYFSRLDISSSDGWQVVDATPQETSDGEYQLGPASKQRIYNRDLKASYDTDFVQSEVDAVVRQYVPYNTGKAKHPFMSGYWLLSEETGETGRWISTKAKLSSSRSDVTSTYKAVFPKAAKRPEAGQEVFFSSQVPDHINLGDPFKADIFAQCLICKDGAATRIISLYYEVTVIDYTGSPIYLLVQNITHATFKDDLHEFYEVEFARNVYQNNIKDNAGLQFSYFAKVYYGNGTWTGASYGERFQIEIATPAVNLTVKNVSSDSFYVDVTLHNPLSIPLTGVTLSLTGAHVAGQDLTLDDIAGDSDLKLNNLVMTLNEVPVQHECTLYGRVITNEVSMFDGVVVIQELSKKK